MMTEPGLRGRAFLRPVHPPQPPPPLPPTTQPPIVSAPAASRPSIRTAIVATLPS